MKNKVDNLDIEMESRGEEDEEEEEESEGDDEDAHLVSESADLQNDPIIDFFLRKFKEIERAKLVVAVLLFISLGAFLALLPARMLKASYESEVHFSIRDEHYTNSVNALNNDLAVSKLTFVHMRCTWNPTTDTIADYTTQKNNLLGSLSKSSAKLNFSNILSLQELNKASQLIDAWIPKADAIVHRLELFTQAEQHKKKVSAGLPLSVTLQEYHEDIINICEVEIAALKEVNLIVLQTQQRKAIATWEAGLNALLRESILLTEAEYLVLLHGTSKRHIELNKAIMRFRAAIQMIQNVLVADQAAESSETNIFPTVINSHIAILTTTSWVSLLNEEESRITVIASDRVAQGVSSDDFQTIVSDSHSVGHVLPTQPLLEVVRLEKESFLIEKKFGVSNVQFESLFWMSLITFFSLAVMNAVLPDCKGITNLSYMSHGMVYMAILLGSCAIIASLIVSASELEQDLQKDMGVSHRTLVDTASATKKWIHCLVLIDEHLMLGTEDSRFKLEDCYTELNAIIELFNMRLPDTFIRAARELSNLRRRAFIPEVSMTEGAIMKKIQKLQIESGSRIDKKRSLLTSSIAEIDDDENKLGNKLFDITMASNQITGTIYKSLVGMTPHGKIDIGVAKVFLSSLNQQLSDSLKSLLSESLVGSHTTINNSLTMLREVDDDIHKYWGDLIQNVERLSDFKSHSPVLETVKSNRLEIYNTTWLLQELDAIIGDKTVASQNEALGYLDSKRSQIRHLRIDVSWVAALSVIICTGYWYDYFFFFFWENKMETLFFVT